METKIEEFEAEFNGLLALKKLDVFTAKEQALEDIKKAIAALQVNIGNQK